MTSKSSANQTKQQNQGGLTTSVASVVMWASRCRVLAAAASGSLLGLSCTHMDDVPWAAVGGWLGIFEKPCKPKMQGTRANCEIFFLIINDYQIQENSSKALQYYSRMTHILRTCYIESAKTNLIFLHGSHVDSPNPFWFLCCWIKMGRDDIGYRKTYPKWKETHFGGTHFHFHDCGRKSIPWLQPLSYRLRKLQRFTVEKARATRELVQPKVDPSKTKEPQDFFPSMQQPPWNMWWYEGTKKLGDCGWGASAKMMGVSSDREICISGSKLISSV